MEKPLVVTYEGIEIAYIEGSNDWRFELRGRSRRAESLSKAKEFIDKEPSKKKPVEPFRYKSRPVLAPRDIKAQNLNGGSAITAEEKRRLVLISLKIVLTLGISC